MKLFLLTSGRQDWGICKPIYYSLLEDPFFKVSVVIGGMHLSKHFVAPEFKKIRHSIQNAIDCPWISDNDPYNIPQQSSDVIVRLCECFNKHKPECIMVVGDRFETMAASMAATISKVKLIHIHGGEKTEGSTDNIYRHAISKMSHLHFTAHKDYKIRLHKLGEDPNTVFNVGAPGLDNFYLSKHVSKSRLEQLFGKKFTRSVILCTMHPSSNHNIALEELNATLKVINNYNADFIVTLPNNDFGSSQYREQILSLKKNKNCTVVTSLGEDLYWSVMKISNCIIGNSSSAIIESPMLKCPVVNIGDRQKGRIKAKNIIDCNGSYEQILESLDKALSKSFKSSIVNLVSPFGDGRTSVKIRERLKLWNYKFIDKKDYT